MRLCWWHGIFVIVTNIVTCNLAVNPAKENCLGNESQYHIQKACMCVVYQSFGKSSGKFHSPNYPEYYDRGIDCILYTFIGDIGEIVELTFIEFDLKPPDRYTGCTFGDFLRIFENIDRPEVNEESDYDRELCGNITGLQQKTYYSRGRSMILEFHSDNKQQGRFMGFRGRFKFLAASQYETSCEKIQGTPCSYRCHDKIPGNHEGGTFFSPNYPQTYPSNADCHYNFISAENTRIKIVFQTIQLYHNRSQECSDTGDHIFIQEPDKEKGKGVYYCGTLSNEAYASSSNQLSITFQSDKMQELKGFAASYEFLSQSHSHSVPIIPETSSDTGPIVDICNKSINSRHEKRGSIKSPGYPDRYPTSQTCIYTFNGTGDERVQIEFMEMSLYHAGGSSYDCANQDSISFYEIRKKRERSVGEHCGSWKPEMFMSSSPYLKIVFKAESRGSDSVTGFMFNWRFVKNFGIKNGVQSHNGGCNFYYDSSISKIGNFTSPNYPGLYPQNTECHYTFQGKEQEKVHITFLKFELEGVYPRCMDDDQKHDYVSFSNYRGVEDRKMVPICGSQDGYSVISDRAFFNVKFRSVHNHMRTGFLARYEFSTAHLEHTAEPPDFSGSSASSGSNIQISYTVLLLTFFLVYHHHIHLV